MTAVGYIGGDPTKVDVGGWTLGDVLAADAAGELQAVPLGAATEVLTVNAAEATDVGWDPPSGSGSQIAVRQSRITTGNVTFPNTAGNWQAVATLDALPIPAVVGDYIEVALTCLLDLASDSFLDIAVEVAGNLVRFLGSGTGTPLIEGNPGLYPDPAFNPFWAPQGFEVEAGDLDGANVQIVLACLATGSGQALASAAFPFSWIVKNFGQVI